MMGVLSGQQDQYGGLTYLPCSGGAQPHFYSEKIDDQWWYCTPAGNAFWEVGIYDAIPDNRTDWQGVMPFAVIDSKYDHPIPKQARLNWGLNTIRRLKAWGFNTLDSNAYQWIVPTQINGAWGTADRTVPEKLPSVYPGAPTANALRNRNNWGTEPIKDLLLGVKTTTYNGWRSPIADYWDPGYAAWIDGMFTNQPVPALNTDWVLGVVFDDADWLWWARWGEGAPGVEQHRVGTHGGWAILVTAPTQTAAYLRLWGETKVYRDTRVYAKEELAAVLLHKYQGIDALNAAWGAAYSTFGTSGATIADEPAGTGDGQTQTFEGTLYQESPAPYSIQVLVDGVPVGGDNGNQTILGASVTGKIDYSSRAFTVTIAPAPAEGAAVTFKYISCGFGCGSGLLDEDGSHDWVPRNSRYNALTGGTDALLQDIDGILEHYSRRYFSTNRAKLDQYWPGVLYMGPTTLEGRAQVYRGAADYVDVIRFGMPDWTEPWYQDRLDFIARHGGDKPWMTWVGKRAVPDSYFASDPRGGGCLTGDVATQEERGEWYEAALQALLTSGAGNTKRFVGMQFWQLFDNQAECANWGLLTRRDNPYDGVSARVQKGFDEWGYPTGGEVRDFGDFISYVKRANKLWLAGAAARMGSPPMPATEKRRRGKLVF